MTEAIELQGAGRASHIRVVGAVSAAHFVSHYYIILLAPLLPFVRADYGVSYTEIGIAFAAFNVVSALLQTPAGFLVDRFGARILLIGGLSLGATALMVAGLVNSFWVMVAMFAVAGLGNTVYHPADYALLSQHVPAKSIGQAFSIHTFAGMLGSGVAPGSLLLLHGFFGWRGAFVGAAIMGFAVAALLVVLREEPAVHAGRRAADPVEKTKSGSLRLLISAPILLNLLFFVLLAMISGGIQNYSVVALGAMYGTPVNTANAGLSAYLLLSSVGVLAGGVLVSRTTRHGAVAAVGLALMALLTVVVGEFKLGNLLLIAAMAVNGFFFGFMMPSRDMIVREVTPPGSFGKVFGFVTTGFNIGGVVSPLIFGALMDHGNPRAVFLLVTASTLLAIVTVATRPHRTYAR
ncbi:MAG TPA: MFS transporter [Pseudolabrys sp.]|jgi:MFS family permease|nr:MFS transporter [Pseudolabrys sp.]